MFQLLECITSLYDTVSNCQVTILFKSTSTVMKHSVWTLNSVPEAQKCFHFSIVILVNQFLLSTPVPTVMQTDNSFLLKTTK